VTSAASEVTTLWQDRNVHIIIVIIIEVHMGCEKQSGCVSETIQDMHRLM